MRSLYSSLSRGFREPFPTSIVWRSWAPMKVSFFAWEASWGRILTLDQLKRRGWTLPNKCYLCKCVEETTNHLLLHCSKARMVWHLILGLFGVEWVMHSSMRENLLGWHDYFMRKKGEKAWRVTLLCLFWTLFGRRGIEEILIMLSS